MNNRLESVESLRGIAAMMIVLYHLVELANAPLPSALGVIRTHFGLGVPLFYVLSGFVLSYGYSEKLKRGADELIPFYMGRFFRIAPLFYAVLLVWRGLGAVLWNWGVPSQSLLLNATFLFGLVPGEHESLVMAGWSIGVEMLFYLIFPVLLVFVPGVWTAFLALFVSMVLSAAAFNAWAAAGLGSYAYMNLVTQLPCFIAGICAFRLWEARRFRPGAHGWLVIGLAMALGAALVASDRLYVALYNLNFGTLHRNVWALIFGGIVYAACTVRLPLLHRGVLPYCGKLSFSLYLLHPIVLVGMMKTGLIARFAGYPVWQGFLVSAGIAMALTVVASWCTHRFIEQPGMALGRKFSTRLKGRQPAIA